MTGRIFAAGRIQPGLRTVQGTLEGALARILGGDPRLVVAGRTDAGVHAIRAGRARRSRRGPAGAADRSAGQVRQPTFGGLCEPVGRARGARRAEWSARTPTSRLHRTTLAPDGFDARFSAVWRRYSYRIADPTTGYDPLERHRTTTVRAQLDEQAMDAAARSLIGLHDFAAYCKPREEATTIRTLLEFDWHRDAEGVLVANIKADAFCHSMVRALVGACVAVGSGPARRRRRRRDPRRGRAHERIHRARRPRAHPDRGRLPCRRAAGRAGRADPSATRPRVSRLAHSGAVLLTVAAGFWLIVFDRAAAVRLPRRR